MDFINTVGRWISDNESLLSGAAAIILLLGVVVSAISMMVRRFRRKEISSEKTDKKISLADLTAPSPYPIKYVESDGLRIAYTRYGNGPNQLMLAPGIISHLHLVAHLPATRNTMDAFGEYCDIICFDKRGQGLSDRCLQVPTLEERVHDIGSILDAEDINSTVLFGVSEGVPMSIKFAVDHPEKVRGLILFGGAARLVQGDDYPGGLEESAMDSIAPNWGKGVLRNIFFPSISKDVMDDQTYKGMERLLGSKESIGQLMEYMKTVDVRELLAQVSCPTLVIHFAGDMAIPSRLGRYMADKIPDAEYLELPGLDHGDLSTSPVGLARVKEFVQSLKD
jgi:pimeloyl-ACP methyl ester carboxylesterase